MKEIYSWVQWFRELARKIEEGGEAYLIEKARQVEWGGNDPPLLQYGDEGIDPFSFFYFLASKARDKQPRKRVYNSVSSVFEIESPLPDTDVGDYYIFPTPPYNANLLFHERENFTPDLLWRLFSETVKDKPNIGSDDFKNALKIKYTRVPKLTQTLFLINPEYFLPVDNSTEILSEVLGLPALSKIEQEIQDGGYKKYESLLKKLKEAFPGCQSYEINMFLYLQKSGKIEVSNNFLQISTDVYDNKKDYWNDFEKNNWVYTNTNHTPYSGWRDSKRGDIILVRMGQKEGRAIGIVQENNYNESEGLNEDSRIHVLWINKSKRDLPRKLGRIGAFTNAYQKTRSVFEETGDYKPSFDLINSLTGNSIKNKSNLDDQQSGADTVKYPLNQILYGPPGTGKTWNTVNYAVAIIESKSLDEIKEDKDARQRFRELKRDGQIAMVTFHQNFTYEDFIEGIRPVLKEDESRDSQDIQYELSEGVFRKIADRAKKNRTGQPDDPKYVLIIDEINRGNIAKIFGELITLIESSKRIEGDDEATVILPYSQDSFGVPDNLYIIGTMNTADRSTAPLDTALRRRFKFVEMMPDLEHHKISTDIEGVNCQELLAAMNKRIRFLFDREHQIGHTYFMDVDDMESLAATFKNRIIPLLQEYFYDNWEKIDLVLNCNGFIDKTSIDSNLFKNSDLIDEERKIYELSDDEGKWKDPKSYKKIYQKGQDETGEAG